ncbi:hypothetical protein F8M41_019957 [Gigaspora margarita]|uniref:Uncharacterized protein n=1 Tax=Gigaspora margarita TaxID=4874 RepID=A0A8H4AJ56_GIGMA|nr:hypothetical protein F8M41_019957 [Gigaspora margarita]
MDSTLLSSKIIEKLRTWPTTNDIQECTQIAFNEAILLAKYIHIDSHEEEFSIPEFTQHMETIVDNIDSENEEDKLLDTFDNEAGLSRSITVDKNEILDEYEILDNKMLDNELLNDDEEIMQQFQSIKKFSEIQYIVQNPPIRVPFCLF